MSSFNRVLAIGAHTDDIELGCGAYLSRLRREGAEIRVIAFSRAETSLAEGMPSDTLEREFRSAMSLLGLTAGVEVGDVPVRNFPAYRQAILERLVSIRGDFAPDLVLTMNSADTHQDHEVIHKETVRAFRGHTVLGYESPWNQATSRNDLFIEVLPEDVDLKVRMLAEYRSQVSLGRGYVDPSFSRSSATFRGHQGRVPLAEMYETLSMVWSVS